jgi:hypothetical protein
MKLISRGQKLGPPRRAKLTVPAKVVDPFYQSAEWRALMASIIEERGARCEDPDHEPGRPRVGIRIFGDHIVERRDGGEPLDRRNILLRCGSCHSRKTAAERARRYGMGGEGHKS